VNVFMSSALLSAHFFTERRVIRSIETTGFGIFGSRGRREIRNGAMLV
jgi:hypothetical protein